MSAFAPLPGLLGRIDVDDLEVSVRPETAVAIATRARDETRRLRASRRRWRTAALAAAALVLVLGAVAVVGGDDGPERAPAVAAAVTASLAETTDVTTIARGWGTQIEVRLAGLPRRERYQLWAVDVDGTWTVAATWGPTGSGGANVTGATSTPADRLGRLVVTSDDRDDVIVDATT